MLDAATLRDNLWPELGAVQDADGSPVGPTPEFESWCRGFLAMLQSSAMQVPVTGKGLPNGGPFNGTGRDGKFGPMTQDLMVREILSANKAAKVDKVRAEVKAIATYLEEAARITLARVTGTCTAATGSPPTPGALGLGAATGGKLTSLDGSELSRRVQEAEEVENAAALPGFFVSLCEYLMDNAEITFTPGQVTGFFPAPGQVPIPIQGGSASGGVLR